MASGLTAAQRDELDRYTADVQAELSRMTVKQLRTYANQHHVPMGGESTKAMLLQEMVWQLRYRRSIEMEDGA